jgi:hypothetical protein
MDSDGPYIDVRRIPYVGGSQISSLIINLDDPIVLENFYPAHDGSLWESRLGSMHVLRQLPLDDQEIVGLVLPDGSEVPVPLSQAIDQLEGDGGYINGWEYWGFARDNSLVCRELEEQVSLNSFIPLLGTGGRMLDSVMRWIFISNKMGTSGSSWHIDPIGSEAFMVMICGSKRWFIEGRQGERFQSTIKEGDLLVVPAGMAHKVENIGAGLNVAVSHNWVTKGTGSEALMWDSFRAVISKIHFTDPDITVLEQIEKLNEEGEIDNLQMGLVMVVFQSWPGIRALVPQDLHGILDRIHLSVNS